MGFEHLENLIARVATGDRGAFDGLYSQTSAKLFGILLRVLQDRAEAEDALQEVFVKIWHNADRYRANGLSPMTWLITIARNHGIDRLRRKRVTQDGSDLAEAVADTTPGPETRAVLASEREQLASCFAELEESRADAVRRAYLEGETYAELAVRFEVPLNTMRTWLRRSLLKLRECLSR